MMDDPLPANGRRMAKIIGETLHETISETFPELEGKEKIALLLFTTQVLFANSFLAASHDRAHAHQGVDMAVKYIKENIDKFYDMKESKNVKRDTPTRSE